MFYLALLFCIRGSDVACKPIVFTSLPAMTLSACLATGLDLGAKRLETHPDLRGYELSHVLCEPASSLRFRRA